MLKRYTIIAMIGLAGLGGLFLIFYLSWFWRLFLIPIMVIVGYGLISSELDKTRGKKDKYVVLSNKITKIPKIFELKV